MIERLAPPDAAFFYTEDAVAPLHVGGVVIVEPQGDFDFRRVVDVIAQRLDVLPRFRQVVREVPGRLARPVWMDDTSFDLDYHVRRSSLPQPGSADQLAELVGRLISRPLDRSRPLWELYIVEGLQGGRVALVNKTHEALVNGVGAVDIAAAVLDERPSTPSPSPQPWVPAPEPSSIDLVVDAVTEIVSRPADIVDTVRLWAADLRSTAATVLDTGLAMTAVARRSLRRGARSSMTVVTPGPRIFAMADIDLGVVKKIRRDHDATVHDVILAIIAGAARAWMLSHGDPVTGEVSLVTLAPTTIWGDAPAGTGTVLDEQPGEAPGRPSAPADRPAGPRSARVTSTLVDLPIGEPNALMRLHQVSFQLAARADLGHPVGADALLALGRFAPAALHGMGARVAGQLSRRGYDLLVTNVPGPQRRLYAAGNPVVAMYPVVPLVKGHALAIACTSYRGRIYVGLTADRDAMPDVSAFAQLIGDAAAELAGFSPAGRRRRAGTGDDR